MKRRSAFAALAAATSLLSVVDAGPAKAAYVSEVFRYNFNDGNLTPVTDVTGGGHSGIVQPSADSVTLIPRPGGNSAVQFPASGVAVIRAGGTVVPDPGTQNFRWGATVRVTPEQVSAGNVVQKGLSSDEDQWKLQVDDGIASCVVKVDGGSPIVLKAGSIADGTWTPLECRKTGTTLAIYKAGVLQAPTTVPAGAIDNTGTTTPTIGAKGTGTNNDQFRGALDQVFFAVDSAAPPAPPEGLTATPATSETGTETVVSNTEPTLTATASDPAGNPLDYTFEVMPRDDETVIASGGVDAVASGTAASWTVPAGLLQHAAAYSFRVRVDNGTETSAWSGRHGLIIDASDASSASSSPLVYGAWPARH